MAELSSRRVLIVDNYDSYAYNLYQAVGELTGIAATVARNDQITLKEIASLNPSHIIISPGPGNPENPEYFGVCAATIRELGPKIPVLGVCLGHQGIGAVFGGRVIRANKVMHGKTSLVFHEGAGVLRSLPNPFEAMRYHSLIIDPLSLPPCLEITAWTKDRVIMGVKHREHPIFGVQFHPESIGTPEGNTILSNFLSQQAAQQAAA